MTFTGFEGKGEKEKRVRGVETDAESGFLLSVGRGKDGVSTVVGAELEPTVKIRIPILRKSIFATSEIGI